MGAETSGYPSPSNSGPTPARGGWAGGMTRGLDTGRWGGGRNRASGGSSSLFKVCGRRRSRLCPPPNLPHGPGRGLAARLGRVASASPSSSARPTATCLSAPAPRGSRIPSPVSIPPCGRAPPAPSLRAGSPARREQKVNEQPQPQRQITMRKINQEIAVRVPLSRHRTPLSTGRGGSAGLPGRGVWGLAGQSLGSAGPWRGRGSEKSPGGGPAGGGGAGTPASVRFHTPSGPRVPTRAAACTLLPPGLLVGPP